MKNLLSILAIVIISSCTSYSQDVTLKLNPNIYYSEIGHNKLIRLEVLDKRVDQTIIGYRDDNENKGIIANYQNLSSILKQNINDGLMKKDFFISDTSDTIMEVSLLSLEYKSLWGSLTRPSEVNCTLEVVVKNTSNKKQYKKTYTKQITTKHIIFPPLALTNEKNITLCLNGLVEATLNDDTLLEFIAK